MEVKILQLLEGAKKATGLTVIIDVFRAFSVEAYIMSKGAEKILPVGDINFAYKYKEQHPDAMLIGERKGKIQEGFDYGNSPSQIENVCFQGKTVVHTTSAGTQGIANAQNADEIITGSLVNAAAIARYIQKKKPAVVSLVCMGLESISETEEDTLCARYIKSLLENDPIELKDEIESLKETSGKKFFDPAQQTVFPEKDFYMSTQVNKFDFVLRYCNDESCGYVQKIDI